MYSIVDTTLFELMIIDIDIYIDIYIDIVFVCFQGLKPTEHRL